MTRTLIEFPPFRLDLAAEQLWRDRAAIALRPKTFAVLRYLVERPGRLVTREELFAAVWRDTVVTDDTLTRSIRELRQAFGDDPRAARYIETVPRRGFRWLGGRTPATDVPAVACVGREEELGQLAAALDAALAGRRQVVFVTGEAGIGKTTLIDAFVRRHATRVDGSLLVGRGHCIESAGPGEPYMPLLDAFGQLAAGPARELVAATFRQHAPAWLARLPSLSEDAEREALGRVTATRERMLRELAVALVALSATVPLVLVLEDLHWSDHATSDVLALVARRAEPARLLVLGAVRPVELLVSGHPLAAMKAELVRQRRASDVPLELLPERAVAEYLALRFTPHDFPAALPALLHGRTEGNPFFVVAALDHLVREGVVTRADGRWTLGGSLERAAAAVPDSVREMIEREHGRLEPAVQEVVQAASVVGGEFAVPAVAAALESDADVVEQRCAALARRHQLIEPAGSERWPDGTPAAGFRFRHGLYRTVLYDRIPPGRRARMHGRIADRLERGFGERVSRVASQLALHCEQSGDLSRAVTYLAKAARRALRQSAPGEAVRGFEKAIALGRALPATDERRQEQLALTLALGDALHLARGYGSPDAYAAFDEGRRLAEAVDALPQQFFAHSGLVAYSLTRCRLADARRYAEHMLALAAQIPVPALGLMANTLAGLARYLSGELASARGLLEQALASGADEALGTQTDFAVMAGSHLAFVLTLLGFPDQGRRVDAAACARARATSRYDEAAALFCSAALAALLRDAPAATRAATAAVELTETHGFPMWHPSARVVRGWAAAAGEHSPAGVTEVREGIAELEALGFERDRTFFLMLLADAQVGIGARSEALGTLDAALARADATGERCYEPELWRAKGELLRARRADAEACLERSLALAREQGARWWELRTATSLARLPRDRARATGADDALAALVAGITEGSDTADWSAARALAAPK
jgi:hypothetical protein